MVLLKGREMVFKAFESGISQLPLQSSQSSQSEQQSQSEHSSNYRKYIPSVSQKSGIRIKTLR